jgi:hypothetical protein
MRGPHSRGVYEGGDQERDLANTNYQAAELSSAWPRTAALLQAIAKTWENEAKRADRGSSAPDEELKLRGLGGLFTDTDMT